MSISPTCTAVVVLVICRGRRWSVMALTGSIEVNVRVGDEVCVGARVRSRIDDAVLVALKRQVVANISVRTSRGRLLRARHRREESAEADSLLPKCRQHLVGS